MADNPTCPACGHYNAVLGRECRDCGVNAVTWTISQLPERFGLAGFPGDVFRCSTLDSYINDRGVVTLYLERLSQQRESYWLAHSKGTLADVLRELVRL